MVAPLFDVPQEGSSVFSLFFLIKLNLASLPLASSYSRVTVSLVFWAQNIYFSAQTRGAPLKKNQYLRLTDPLRIQPWSQDRRNETKSNREHIPKKNAGKTERRKRTGNLLAKHIFAREDHRRDIINTKQKHKQKQNQKQTKDNHTIRVGQEKYPRRQAPQERQSYKQRNITQAGRQE